MAENRRALRIAAAWLTWPVAAVCYWSLAALLCAQAADKPSPVEGTRVLTNLAEIWSVPQSLRSQPWPIRTEFLVYYQDAAWNCSWGEYQGDPFYLPLGRAAPDFKSGQRVFLDGFILPERQQVLWERSQYRVLQEAALPNPLPTQGRLADSQALRSRWVAVEGLIDTQAPLDGHLRLNLLAQGLSLTVFSPHFNPTNAPDLEGAFVRLNGVYNVGRTLRKNAATIDLWVPDLSHVEIIGRLDQDQRFSGPLTTSDQFGQIPSNQLVRVEGTVRSAEPGRSVTIWDATGQVEIRTLQSKRFVIGQRVEAIGYPSKENIFLTLREGLLRPKVAAQVAATPKTGPQKPAKLFLAAQVRELSPEDAATGIPVQLEGMLLWSRPGTPFLFIQDASAGVRVYWTARGGRAAPEPGSLVQIQGVTTRGDFCPAITNALLKATDALDLPEAQFITLEHALTGVEEGQWVEMGGCVREVTMQSGTCWLKVATTAGEFDAVIPRADWMETLSGSIVRLRGVCTAVCNDRGHLKGIQLWVPQSSLLQIDESEPSNPFELPLHPLGKLRQFNALNSLHHRVRTQGTVLLHEPGRYLFVQDGSDGLFVLSRATEPLAGGDRVEVVGFPGRQQGRFLLREALYRRLGPGREPGPVPLLGAATVDEDLESRLVKAQGRLLEALERGQTVTLLLQGKGGLFEAVLAGSKLPPEQLEPNSKLALTGVYEVKRDEYGQPAAFRLHLRNPNDLQVLEPAPWWTPGRLLWIVLATLCVVVLALLWGMTVSRKNALLERAQGQLELANRTLETRVDERTRELHEEVVAKETARRDLAAAQERLLRASRQAGMTEVATSVLHNVGNVLNSVNISTSVLQDMVRKSKAPNLAKVAVLLREQQGNLDAFVSRDPKGKQVIPYLETLSKHLDQEKHSLDGELRSLTKNLDHIKEIVAMQQAYAKAGGVLEVLKPTEVVEDALRMQAASFQRHAVTVVREFADLPPITIDRHKVLQILNNLLQNAKNACEANDAGSCKVIVRVRVVDAQSVRIEVADNGVGIAPENLTRIFSLGFTTRKNGHGFGLHSAALAAKEMGGTLAAQSEGPGQGATFVLQLPLPKPDSNGKTVGAASAAS